MINRFFMGKRFSFICGLGIALQLSTFSSNLHHSRAIEELIVVVLVRESLVPLASPTFWVQV